MMPSFYLSERSFPYCSPAQNEVKSSASRTERLRQFSSAPSSYAPRIICVNNTVRKSRYSLASPDREKV